MGQWIDYIYNWCLYNFCWNIIMSTTIFWFEFIYDICYLTLHGRIRTWPRIKYRAYYASQDRFYFYVPPGMIGGTLCLRVVRPSIRRSLRPSHFIRGTTLRAAPNKSYSVSTNYYACIAMPTWFRCAPPILFGTWSPYSMLPRSSLNSIFFIDPQWGVPLCVQRPTNAMPFQQIIMYDIDVHLIFWPWPPFNLFPRPSLTWIFFIDPHW